MKRTSLTVATAIKWLAALALAAWAAHLLSSGPQAIIGELDVAPTERLEAPAPSLLEAHDATCWTGGEEALTDGWPGHAIVRLSDGRETIVNDDKGLLTAALNEALGVRSTSVLDPIAFCL